MILIETNIESLADLEALIEQNMIDILSYSVIDSWASLGVIVSFKNAMNIVQDRRWKSGMQLSSKGLRPVLFALPEGLEYTCVAFLENHEAPAVQMQKIIDIYFRKDFKPY